MSITPTQEKTLEIASTLSQPAWSQLTSTAGASDAIVQREAPVGNRTGEGEDLRLITPADLARVVGGTVTEVMGQPGELISTGFAGRHSLAESAETPLLLGKVALYPGVIEAYARRLLAPMNITWESLTPITVNVEPLALLRMVRANPAAARNHALADARRSLDRAKTLESSRSPGDIVVDLSETFGLNQLSTARAVGVTPTAVRKWRRGEPARAEFRDRLALLIALLHLLRHAGQDQPAGWLEVPVSNASTLTPLDLFAGGRADLALLLGSGADDPEAALDSFDADWRRRFAPDRDYAVVVGADGSRVVVPRADDGS